jgi:hypothetical protein
VIRLPLVVGAWWWGGGDRSEPPTRRGGDEVGGKLRSGGPYQLGRCDPGRLCGRSVTGVRDPDRDGADVSVRGWVGSSFS